jgi:Mini-chromosome maintenance replisome factor
VKIDTDLGIPQFIEKTLELGDDLSSLPSLNTCNTQEEISAISGKIVTFECMIQDMYNEEYFVQVLQPLNQDGSVEPLFYKYYSELTEEQMNTYEMDMIDQRYAS